MATHEADLEYGPTPPDAMHEHTDIEPSVAWKFALWLAAGMVVSVLIVYGTFWFFERSVQESDRRNQAFPLAVGQERTPPLPHLQTQPFKDVYLLRQHENEVLGSYGWVDKNAGIVRLPIDRAMELVLERGLPVREGAGGAGQNQVVEDSSAGRTAATR